MERLKPVEALTLMAASVYIPVDGPAVGHVGGPGERFAAASRLGLVRGGRGEGPGDLETQPSVSSRAPPAHPPAWARGLEGPGLRLPSASYHTLCGKDH